MILCDWFLLQSGKIGLRCPKDNNDGLCRRSQPIGSLNSFPTCSCPAWASLMLYGWPLKSKYLWFCWPLEPLPTPGGQHVLATERYNGCTGALLRPGRHAPQRSTPPEKHGTPLHFDASHEEMCKQRKVERGRLRKTEKFWQHDTTNGPATYRNLPQFIWDPKWLQPFARVILHLDALTSWSDNAMSFD